MGTSPNWRHLKFSVVHNSNSSLSPVRKATGCARYLGLKMLVVRALVPVGDKEFSTQNKLCTLPLRQQTVPIMQLVSGVIDFTLIEVFLKIYPHVRQFIHEKSSVHQHNCCWKIILTQRRQKVNENRISLWSSNVPARDRKVIFSHSAKASDTSSFIYKFPTQEKFKTTAGGSTMRRGCLEFIEINFNWQEGRNEARFVLNLIEIHCLHPF